MKNKKHYNNILKKTHSYIKEYEKAVLSDVVNDLKDKFVNHKISANKILPRAIALGYLAISEILHKQLFDVQIIGAAALAEGNIIEMKTGEGKTFVAVPAAIFRAILGESVHIVTVNDYLAETQSTQLVPVYSLLGLSVGCITEDVPRRLRKDIYQKDIVYGTNKQLGFDYLYDNMKTASAEISQSKHEFVIIDEVDSILIDEARTPLIVARTEEIDSETCIAVSKFVKTLKEAKSDGNDTRYENLKKEMLTKYHEIEGDYLVNRTFHTVALTTQGIEKIEKHFNISNVSSSENTVLMGMIQDALYAHVIMQRDKDYVVEKGKIYIVDEFTGRVMKDRRFANGIHQAIEAKEGVPVMAENKIKAMITIQNFFKLYDTISGMTGTAATERKEFKKVYDLDVVVIPTNKPVIRVDHPDVFFNTDEECYEALINDIAEINKKGQPILIGTRNVADSEKIAKLLSDHGFSFNLLNAKNHKQEAIIVAQAGRSNSITIATNMAGRGTDILLGGNAEMLALERGKKDVNPASLFFDEEVAKASEAYLQDYKMDCEKDNAIVVNNGGLFVLGLGRNTARRIDNQLIGRAGRQGDPGESRYYISMEDEFFAKYGFNSKEGAFILGRTNKRKNKVVKSIQNKVKNISFEARNETFKVDSVNNVHRNYVYSLRSEIIQTDNIMEYIEKAIFDAVSIILKRFNATNSFNETNKNEIINFIKEEYLVDDVPFENKPYEDFVVELRQFIRSTIKNRIEAANSCVEFNKDAFLKSVLIRKIDVNWEDFLSSVSTLSTSTSMNVFSALTPMQAYKIESSELYELMIDYVKLDVVKWLMTMATTPNSYNYEVINKIVV